MEEATIQLSLENARNKFMDWNVLREDEGSDPQDREDSAVEALMALSDVVSRGSMNQLGDLLSFREFRAVRQSLFVLRKEESDVIFHRSLNHCIQRLVSDVTTLSTDKEPTDEQTNE